MALSVLVISGSAALYAFAMRRAAQDAGKAQVLSQAQAVAEDISRTVRQSIGCDAFTNTGSGTFAGALILRCALPESKVDTDSTAGPDAFVASKANEGGVEVYIPGSHVFYVWLATGWQGDPNKRMVRITQTSPDPADFTNTLTTWDPSFTFTSVTDEKFRFDRLSDVQFQVDSQNRSVLTTVTGTGNGLNSSQTAEAGDDRNLRAATVQRRTGWINELDSRDQGRGSNLLVNGDFAKKTWAGWTQGGVTSSYFLSTNYSVAQNSFYSVQMNQGNVAGGMVLSQDVSLTDGEEYVLSFSLGVYCAGQETSKNNLLKVTILDVESGDPLVERIISDRSAGPAGDGFWTDYSIAFRPVNNSHRIIFTDLTTLANSASCDPFLAKISLRRLN